MGSTLKFIWRVRTIEMDYDKLKNKLQTVFIRHNKLEKRQLDLASFKGSKHFLIFF